MIKRFNIIDGKVVESENQHDGILFFISPDEKERKMLLEDYRIDEHNLTSALDPDELARLETEEDHVYMILKLPKSHSAEDQFVFKIVSIGMFLFENKLIIVMSEDIPMFDMRQFIKVKAVREIMLKIIYRCIYHYLHHLKAINMISEELEDKINASMENKFLLYLFSLEKSMVYYLNAINSNAVLMEKIKLNAKKIGLSEEDSELLDDIIIENTQCYKQAEIYSNILASMMDARVSIVSNNLNVLMKRLNILTIAIMVPTLVVSIFSMNVAFPLQNYMYAFWLIVGLAFISMTAFLMFWKYKK